MGEEKTKEIERDPEIFIDFENYRLWSKKPNLCALLTGAVGTYAIKSFVPMKKPILPIAIFVILFGCSRYGWKKYLEKHNDKILSFNYARTHVMLRNAVIKQ